MNVYRRPQPATVEPLVTHTPRFGPQGVGYERYGFRENEVISAQVVPLEKN